jgi:succinate-acetate transporter protein
MGTAITFCLLSAAWNDFTWIDRNCNIVSGWNGIICAALSWIRMMVRRIGLHDCGVWEILSEKG